METIPAASGLAWRSTPLCHRYQVARFQILPFRTVEDGFPSFRSLRWALGVLCENQWEVLGVWPVPRSGSGGWDEVFYDLGARGTNVITSVVSSEAVSVDLACRKASQTSLTFVLEPVVRSVEQANRPLCQMVSAADNLRLSPAATPRRQRGAPASERGAQQLQSRARLAIARHGDFEDVNSACSFVTGALAQSERKLVRFL
jgi:hypothetical protein